MRQAIVFGALGIGLGIAALALLSSNRGENVAPATIDAGVVEPRAPAPPTSLGRAPPASGEAPAASVAVGAEDDADAPAGASAGRPEARVDLLVAAGFERARAEEIDRRELELRRAAAYREYESTGTVRALGGAAQQASEAGLRTELGDPDFERYLAALGRPTRVVVAGVAAPSAAANAGLLPGDEIRAYGGERVFNLRELDVLALQRSAGETVAVTVVRDGQTLQLYVTGGPLGVTPPELR